MGFVKYMLSKAGYLTVYSVILVTLLIFIPGIPPDYDFQSFNITPPIKPKDWMTKNSILDKVELYFKGEHVGPESTAVLGDVIFTGDTTGNIIKVQDGVSSIVTRLQFSCGEFQDEINSKCSYPLGMRFDQTGHLMVMDLHGGLIKINVETGKYDTLVSKWLKIDGKASRNPEDLDIAKDGTIYWSDGSTVDMGFTELLGQASGRLLKYDPKTKKNTVLIEKIHLSNGVCLSANEDFVLVAEMVRSQIRRYYLKGEKAGQSDIFIDGLPGYPDNIRSNGKGGFYVPLFTSWNDEFSWPFHTLSSYPLTRKVLLRSRHLIRMILNGLKLILPPNTYLDYAIEYVEFMVPLMSWNNLPKTSTIVELSNTGEIIGILNGRNGNVYSISEIVIGGKYAYINAPFSRKLWRIRVEDLQETNIK